MQPAPISSGAGQIQSGVPPSASSEAAPVSAPASLSSSAPPASSSSQSSSSSPASSSAPSTGSSSPPVRHSRWGAKADPAALAAESAKASRWGPKATEVLPPALPFMPPIENSSDIVSSAAAAARAIAAAAAGQLPSAMPIHLPPMGLSEKDMEIWKLKTKIDEVSLMINCPALIREDPSRFAVVAFCFFFLCD